MNDFAALTTVLAERCGHQVRYWLTFNEEFFYEFIEKDNYPLDAAQVLKMRDPVGTQLREQGHRAQAYDLR